MNYTIVFSGILFLLFTTSLASEVEDAAKAKAKGSKRKLFFQIITSLAFLLCKFDFFFYFRIESVLHCDFPKFGLQIGK